MANNSNTNLPVLTGQKIKNYSDFPECAHYQILLLEDLTLDYRGSETFGVCYVYDDYKVWEGDVKNLQQKGEPFRAFAVTPAKISVSVSLE